MEKIEIYNCEIQYDNNNIKIVDSYKITSKKTMKKILNKFLSKTGYKTKRSIKSFILEWKAHNLMYNMGIFIRHTKDTDLEQNEKLYRRICYQILGRI